MKKQIFNKYMFFLGGLLTAGTSILNRYVAIPDLLHGVIFGIGIGMLILVVIRGRVKPSC